MKNITKAVALGLGTVILSIGISACVDTSVGVNARVDVNGSEVINTQLSTDEWETADIMEITSTQKGLFAEAVGQLDGYFYEPIAMLATKTGSGTTFCFLCQSTIVANDSVNILKLTYIKLDDNGNASFVKDEDLLLPGAGDGTTVGSWAYADSPEITDEIRDVINKASETLTGAVYEPVAYLGSQVVAGTNHAILCKAVPSTSGLEDKGSYVIVYIYEDLEGNCEITETTDIDL